MNVQKIEIAINQLERVHRDMNNCANKFILKDAIDQIQEQLLQNHSTPTPDERGDELFKPCGQGDNVY